MTVGRLRDGLVRRVGRRFFFGWAVLGVAALGIFASEPGQSHTFSVFVGPLGGDMALSATTIASAYGLATLAAALCLPLVGRLLDRHGARRMLLLVAALLGLACVAFGAVAGIAWLAIGFAALRFFGQGSLMLCCAYLVSQWFSRRRGLALSLMALGFSLSMAVHPPLAQWLIDLVGWREAWLWIGLATWVLLPPVMLVVVDRPEDVALRPDGDAAPVPRTAAQEGTAREEGGAWSADAAPPAAEAGLTLRQALRTPAFHIIAAGLLSLSMLVTALHFFQVSIFTAHGLEARLAAKVFPVSALTMVAAMPLIGRMLDRYRTEWMFSGGLVVMAASLVAATLVESLWTAVGYAVIFGLNNALSMTFFSFMWPRYFGRRHLGSIQGVGQMIAIFGASLGPLPLGLALLPGGCAVMALFVRAPALSGHP